MRNGPSFPLLIDELKRILKRKGIKYSRLASELGMSESSIKRLMSGSDANLSKLESLCEVAGISFLDLVILTKDQKPKDFFLTKAQDDFFAKNTNYFYVFHLLYEERMSVLEIKKKYNLSDKSMMTYLKKLEEFGFCERHANDKIVWLITGHISLPEMTELGRHLTRTSIDNLKELVVDGIGGDNKKEGTFQISEGYLRPETAKRFMVELGELIKKIGQASSREERVYKNEELILYTSISSLLPIRLYYEDVENI
ncbi:MAG: transcriptional regulator with XRE-family HTH domain [Bacteriovoracaceae bacterium]|jgi:transcriptional regulator with XRE-family HTH domain